MLKSIKEIIGDTKEKLYTGLGDLDNIIGDLKEGELIILGSRPAMGKSTLLLKIARMVALKNNTVALFSLENSKEQCVVSILSDMAKVDKLKIKKGSLNDEENQRIHTATEQLKNANIYIDDTPGIAIDKIKEQISNMNKKVDLVLIDYWQLLNYEEDNKNIIISHKLKELAQELKVPVIVTYQLSRDVDKREDKTPVLSDMNCIEEINEDADVIIFLYIDSYYYEIGCDETELIVAKNKYGECGSVMVEI